MEHDLELAQLTLKEHENYFKKDFFYFSSYDYNWKLPKENNLILSWNGF